MLVLGALVAVGLGMLVGLVVLGVLGVLAGLAVLGVSVVLGVLGVPVGLAVLGISVGLGVLGVLVGLEVLGVSVVIEEVLGVLAEIAVLSLISVTLAFGSCPKMRNGMPSRVILATAAALTAQSLSIPRRVISAVCVAPGLY